VNTVERLKQTVLKTGRRWGIEISKLKEVSESATLRRLADERGIRIAVDVGANEGQFGRGLRSSGFAGDIVSLEPLAGPFSHLAREASGDSRWRCLNVALSTESGRLDMRVAGNLGMSSSFMPATAVHDRYAPGAAVMATESVSAIGWDDLEAELPTGAALLKLDIQGYEGEVLRADAAERFLERVPVLICEISLASLYDGAWSPAACLTFMEDRGYEVFSLLPEWMDRPSGRVLAMNGIFVRT
jgi:FkbM family methyltransferase